MEINIYTPVNTSEIPRGAGIAGLPDPMGRVIAAVDTHGKQYRNRVTRAAIRFKQAKGAKLALRRFEPTQLRLVATIRTNDWQLGQIFDKDSMEVWSRTSLQ